MGKVTVDIELCGKRKCKVFRNVVVDTGAMVSVIPESVARSLGMDITRSKGLARFIDGREFKVLFAIGEVRIKGVPIPETFALIKGCKEIVIGLTTLEKGGFIVDPEKGELIRREYSIRI